MSSLHRFVLAASLVVAGCAECRPLSRPSVDPPVPAPSTPYRAGSPSSLPDEEVLRFMGPGNLLPWSRREFVPDWRVRPAEDTIVGIADDERPLEHRRAYRLFLEGPAPTGSMRAIFTRPGFDGWTFWFERDGEEAWLGWGWIGLWPERRVPLQGIAFGWEQLPEADGAWLAAALAAIPRLRLEPLPHDSEVDLCEGSPLAGARAFLEVVIEHRLRTVLSGDSNDRPVWIDSREPPLGTQLELARRVLCNEAWHRFAGWPWNLSRPSRDLLVRNARAILDRVDPEERRVSFDLALVVVEAAGEEGLVDLAPDLDRVRRVLDAMGPPDLEPLDLEIVGWGPLDPSWGAAFDEDRRRAAGVSVRCDLDRRSLARARLWHAVRLARRKIEVLDSSDPGQALLRWAISREEGAAWAARRLGELDPRRSIEVLEPWHDLASQVGGMRPDWILQDIADRDPAAALRIMERRDLPEGLRDEFDHAFRRVLEAAAIPEQDRRVEALLAIVRDVESKDVEVHLAIDRLVPIEHPDLYAAPELDRVLIDALARRLEPDGDVFDEIVGERIAVALAQRRAVEAYGLVRRCLRTWRRGLHDRASLLVSMSQDEPDPDRAALVRDVGSSIGATGSVVDAIWLAWAGDLRELRRSIEALATGSTEDVEESEPRTIRGLRLHLARQVLSIWDEADPATRVKLLLAFALGRSEAITDRGHPERLRALEIALENAVGALDDAGRERARVFLQRAIERLSRDSWISPEIIRVLSRSI